MLCTHVYFRIRGAHVFITHILTQLATFLFIATMPITQLRYYHF